MRTSWEWFGLGLSTRRRTYVLSVGGFDWVFIACMLIDNVAAQPRARGPGDVGCWRKCGGTAQPEPERWLVADPSYLAIPYFAIALRCWWPPPVTITNYPVPPAVDRREW